MRESFLRNFLKDESAAIAATYTLLLIPIVGLAGVAYDFAQMASLDTEVQNAADQAALAAATQLTGTDTAITDATAAASDLVANKSVMANDGKPATLSVSSVVFYSNRSDAEADTNSFTDTSKSASASFVKVTLDTRQAKFALTPIVGLFMSPAIGAAATAGMGSALCNVPPVMMCNPNEGTDNDFNDDYVGDGLDLVSVGSGGGAWAPGNFGYLDTHSGSTSNPILQLKQALGWDSPPGLCQPQTGVDTQTGADTPVTDALNTRFDINANGGPGGGACPTGGTCSPSTNTVKDVVYKGNNWVAPKVQYQADATTRLPVMTPTAMGFPRDICHAISSAGDCASYTGNSKIGDGNWDRATYFAVNFPGFDWQNAKIPEYGADGQPVTTGTPPNTTPVYVNPANATRYEVYRWENDNENLVYNTATGAKIGDPRTATNGTSYGQPLTAGTGINPDNGIDRRTIPVAVVNCTANSVNGSSNNVPVIKWMNMFLVQPSLARKSPVSGGGQLTTQQEVYVEVVSVNDLGSGGGTGATLVRRDKPYLVK